VINTVNNTWYNYYNPQINITATDNIYTNLNYTLYANGSVDSRGNMTNGTNMLTNLTIVTDGQYQIILGSYDPLGNIANGTAKYIYVDTHAPTITLNVPINAANFTVRTVVLNYTVNDNLASNATCNVTLDGNNVASSARI